MPRALQKCADCPRMCFGKRCMACSHAAAPRRRTDNEGIVIAREGADYPESSWWVDAVDFYAAAKVEAVRMLKGNGIVYQPKHSDI